jgi:flagellar secretion chaperone FliS
MYTQQQFLRAYREADLTSIGKEKMVVLLYEKMLEHYRAAEQAAQTDDRVQMTSHLSKGQRIAIELRNALDHEVGGEIARSLSSLYDFVFQESLAMLVDRAPAHAANCVRVLEPLLAAWRQIPPGTAERMARQFADEHGTNPASPSAGDRNPADAPRLISVSA